MSSGEKSSTTDFSMSFGLVGDILGFFGSGGLRLSRIQSMRKRRTKKIAERAPPMTPPMIGPLAGGRDVVGAEVGVEEDDVSYLKDCLNT